MLLNGVIIRNCVVRNMPDSLGVPIDNITKGTSVTITDIEKTPSGTWYYIGANGWIKARDFKVTHDVGFMIRAKKSKILDLQRFGPEDFGIVPLTDNSIVSNNKIPSNINIDITTHPGGCFGDAGKVTTSSKKPENDANNFGKATVKDVANGFGLNVGTGFWGDVAGKVTIDSLFDGSFLETLIDCAIDALFGWLFKRLGAVIGFDIEAILSAFYGIFDTLTVGDFLDQLENGGLAALWNSNFDLTAKGGTNLWNSVFGLSSYGSANLWDSSFGLSTYGSSVYYPGEFGFSSAFMASVHYFDYLGCSNGEVVHNIGHSGHHYWTDAQNLDFRTPLFVLNYDDGDFSTPLLSQDDSSTEDFTTDLLTQSEDNETDYSTPLLNGDLPEQDSIVKFNTDLYNNTYEEFQESIEKIKKNVNFSISRLDWFTNFNRYGSTEPDYHLTGSKGHVFMTRPALNIFGSSASDVSTKIKESADAAFFAEAINRHSIIAKSLTPNLSGSHDFIPIIHNAARSIDIQDTSIDTLEHGETLTKWKIIYAKNAIKSMTSGTFSIDYVDDSQLSISYLHLVWLYYMNGVSRGEFEPNPEFVKNGILDYASSCYYILTDITGENIIFWSKYWGVFPTNYPSSSFSMKSGDMVKVPDITIQYAYSFKKDMDPLILAEFNRNSLNNKNFEYIPIHGENQLGPYPAIVGSPFIEKYVTQPEGIAYYKLRFRKAPDTENDAGSFFRTSVNTSIANINTGIAGTFDNGIGVDPMKIVLH